MVVLAELEGNQSLSEIPTKIALLKACWHSLFAFVCLAIFFTLAISCLVNSWWAASAAVAFAVAFVAFVNIMFRIIWPANFAQRAIITAGLAMSALTLAAGYSGLSGILRVEFQRLTAKATAEKSSADANGNATTELKWGECDHGTMLIGCLMFGLTIVAAHLLRPDPNQTTRRAA